VAELNAKWRRTLNNDSVMKNSTVLRIAAGLVALPATGIMIAFAPPIVVDAGRIQLISSALDSSFVTASALFWWLAFRGHVAKDRAIILSALGGAIIFGVIGAVGTACFRGVFLAVIAGGPLGFIVGTLLGGVAGLVRMRLRRS
jgi:hypothetical protein